MADYKKLLKFLNVDPIINDLVAIVEAKIELLKIELKEEVAKVATKIISAIFLGIMVFLIVIFLSITIATFLNEVLDSHFWGYTIVTGFYLFLLVGFKLFKVGDKLEQTIEASLNSMAEEETEEVDNE